MKSPMGTGKPNIRKWGEDCLGMMIFHYPLKTNLQPLALTPCAPLGLLNQVGIDCPEKIPSVIAQTAGCQAAWESNNREFSSISFFSLCPFQGGTWRNRNPQEKKKAKPCMVRSVCNPGAGRKKQQDLQSSLSALYEEELSHVWVEMCGFWQNSHWEGKTVSQSPGYTHLACRPSLPQCTAGRSPQGIWARLSHKPGTEGTVSSTACASGPSGPGQLLFSLALERKLADAPGSYLFSLAEPANMWLSATQELRGYGWSIMGRGPGPASSCATIRAWRHKLEYQLHWCPREA